MATIENLESVSSRASGGAGKNLKFPQDLGEMSRNQHYITFFINQQDNAIIKFPTASNQYGIDGNSQQAQMLAAQDAAFSDEPSTTLTLERAPTTRLAGSIQLFMPNQLQVGHKANYGEPEMGAGIAFIQQASKAVAGTGQISMEQATDFAAQEARNMLQGIAEGAGSAFSGAKAATAITTGKVIVNRSEVAFEGIDRRTFQFEFRMLPRSAEEADQIELIVTQFRMHSMPEIMDVIGGRTMIPPSTFDIEYTPDTHLHRISTCVLESVNVSYGGDRTQFFEDGHPVQTVLSLQFKELEIITKRRVAQGF